MVEMEKQTKVWKWNFVKVSLNDIVQLNGGNGIQTKWWKVENRKNVEIVQD